MVLGIWMCRGKDMNVMVMDVEGTDGRERGEDQVSTLSIMLSICLDDIYIFLRLGLRTQIRAVFSRLLRNPHRQLVGAPGRSVPGGQHGSPEDRV